ncbi:MAG: hypothetical protein NWE94_09105 [Candidatus Bathyarchaeota archaeon]|nr:hypothetical protein [Candidatus Bathyarchaeota archaeon]
MKPKHLLITLLLVTLLAVALFLRYAVMEEVPSQCEPLNLFVGVDAAYDSLEEIKTIVDVVSPYTNLFIIGSSGITYNTTKLDEACQYVYDKGLSFILFTEHPFRTGWLQNATAKWGNKFLGFYIYDEIGGRQLDIYQWRPVWKADNYTHASEQFVSNITMYLNRVGRNHPETANLQRYTSDYALYWFDYKSGYDVVFAEFGWNYSRQLNVALCRGAATAQNKDWGVIMTWTYTQPPYLESGEELYNDMVTAYENGAKYIVIFDTNENYTHGILQEDHLNALKRFWQYAAENPRTNSTNTDRVAFVLPKDFAYGFRGPSDKIWGLWEATSLANELCITLNNHLDQYGVKLDVIYDEIENYTALPYSKIIFWNGTVLTP